jgi:hypothetical protein
MLQPVEAQCLKALPGVAHGFFGRAGGVSEGIYAALNCGLGSRDEPARATENRARVAGHLGTDPSRLLTCYQIHSPEVVVAERPWTRETMPKADAIVTATPGLAIGALAADCAPVLLADAEARVIGAAHAGWKGAVTGVVEATVAAMVRLGARRAAISAALGPCIGPMAYEVGPELEAEVVRLDAGAARFFRRPRPEGRPYFDLPGYLLEQLSRARLGAVESRTACTYAGHSSYFSYRRSVHRKEPDYGRQISAILLR